MEVILEDSDSLNSESLAVITTGSPKKDERRKISTTVGTDVNGEPKSTGRKLGVCDAQNSQNTIPNSNHTVKNLNHNSTSNNNHPERKTSHDNSATKKMGIGGSKPERKISVTERKVSVNSGPEGRKISTISNGKMGLGPDRKVSRTESMISGGVAPPRKIGVLKRTLTQMTMSHLEIGSLKEEGSVFEEFVSKKTPQILAALAATSGAFAMGTVMAFSSPALPQIQEEAKFNHPTEGILSWIAALVPAAAIFAGPPIGQAIERIGRRPTMIALSVPFVLGWLLIAFAVNIPMMLVGRFLTGFCAGSFSLTAPVFISETAEDSIRGTLGSGFQFMVTLGILFSYTVGAFVSWQWLAIISAVVPVIMLILMIYVPASPRYLLKSGQEAEASKALAWFRGAESSQQIEEELRIIQKSIDEAIAKEVKLKDFFSASLLKPISISVALMFFQSFSGTDAVTFYTVQIFEDAGSSLDGNLATIIVGTVQCIATFLSVVLMDRAGRRVLLLASDAVMALSLASLGAFFFLSEEQKPDFGWLPLLSLVVFVAAYSIGFGPIPWLMMGEILPNHVIGVASAIATSFNWIFTFLVIKFFPDVQNGMGQNWSYIMFSAFCVAGIVFVYIVVPETKGKSLDEIQLLFTPKNSKLPAPNSRKVSRTTIDSFFFA